MQNVKAHNKMKLDPAICMEHIFSSKVIKAVSYLAMMLASFVVLFFSAHAGMEAYPGLYSIDAKMENDSEIGSSSEIRIVFNQPVVFLEKNNIEITPSVEFDFILSPDGKEFTLYPKDAFLSETRYEINFKEARGLSGLAMNDRKFVFYTKYAENEKRDIELKDRETVFSEFVLSKNKYVPPEVSTPKIDLEFEPKFKDGKYIDVSIDYQIMTLFENGIKVNSFLVSSGIPGMSTPLGIYSIKRKEDNHWSGYGLWMPYSMNFSGPYFIHELPYWPSGFREGESHLGIKASHGCIRLGIGPAKYVYDWAEIGTQLYIHK